MSKTIDSAKLREKIVEAQDRLISAQTWCKYNKDTNVDSQHASYVDVYLKGAEESIKEARKMVGLKE